MKITPILVALPLLTGNLWADADQVESKAIETLKNSEQFYTQILSQSEMIGLNEDIADFSRKLAAVDLELGEFTKALNFIEKALENYRTLDTSQINVRLNVVDSRILKGRLLGFLRQYKEAVEELLSVFEENLVIRGENDPETTRLYKHIGWHLGRFAKKGGHLQDLKNVHAELGTLSLALEDKNLTASEGDSQVILLLAQKCYEKAVLNEKVRVGENHPDIAKSYSLIGWILGDRGQYSEALEYHMKALAIRLECLSEIHSDTARSYNNIGWNYEQLGNYEDALKYYRLSLKIKEQTFVQGHPELEKTREHIQRVESLLSLKTFNDESNERQS